MTETDPKRAAYSAATTRLRDQHRDDFNILLREEMARRNVEWAPRPTDQQKAERQVNDLFEKYPELKVKFTG
jgi:transcription initiation factor TFIID subunit TAF12